MPVIAGEINSGSFMNSPFGKPNDQLWVRETFSIEDCCDGEYYYKASIRDKSWYDKIELWNKVFNGQALLTERDVYTELVLNGY